MQTVTFGKSSFECSNVCISTPPHDATAITMSWAPTAPAVRPDYHFAVYADGKHVGDLHDATLEGNTLRGLFVHA